MRFGSLSSVRGIPLASDGGRNSDDVRRSAIDPSECARARARSSDGARTRVLGRAIEIQPRAGRAHWRPPVRRRWLRRLVAPARSTPHREIRRRRSDRCGTCRRARRIRSGGRCPAGRAGRIHRSPTAAIAHSPWCPPPTSTQYVSEKGLEKADAHREQAECRSSGRARSLLASFEGAWSTSAMPGTAAFDRALGLRLELVAESDLSRADADAPRSFRLLHEGEPLVGALVTATRPGTADPDLKVRTDSGGRAQFEAACARHVAHRRRAHARSAGQCRRRLGEPLGLVDVRAAVRPSAMEPAAPAQRTPQCQQQDRRNSLHRRAPVRLLVALPVGARECARAQAHANGASYLRIESSGWQRNNRRASGTSRLADLSTAARARRRWRRLPGHRGRDSTRGVLRSCSSRCSRIGIRRGDGELAGLSFGEPETAAATSRSSFSVSGSMSRCAHGRGRSTSSTRLFFGSPGIFRAARLADSWTAASRGAVHGPRRPGPSRPWPRGRNRAALSARRISARADRLRPHCIPAVVAAAERAAQDEFGLGPRRRAAAWSFSIC